MTRAPLVGPFVDIRNPQERDFVEGAAESIASRSAIRTAQRKTARHGHRRQSGKVLQGLVHAHQGKRAPTFSPSI